ncbi:MAG: DUF1513 domain-containing protein [Thalassotalea sp.]|nr:DUF1513 domain-containing protein [Thalassotalea sp.]
MSISRRQFLLAAGGVAAASIVGFAPKLRAKEHWLVSACSDGKGKHFAAAFDLNGRLINQVTLPARGHEVIPHPKKPGHALVFARRPGEYLIEANFNKGEIVKTITPESGFHFYGHGITINNQLITAENDYHKGRGAIVLRDLNTYEVTASVDSGGIGPHQIAMMPDNKTLVIANGGILTHPSQPRKKLNLDTMLPNLSYMALDTGQIISRHDIDNPKLSIRHLDVSQSGQIVAGLQYQGAKTDLVPLAVSHQGNDKLTYLSATEDVWRKMNQYTASVCIDNNTNIAAISCPRADIITYWSLESGQFIGEQRLADGAGLTYLDGIIASSGKGLVIKTSSDKAPTRFDKLRWDNHLGHIQAGINV